METTTEKQIIEVLKKETKKPWFLDWLEREKNWARVEGFKQGQKAEARRKSKELPEPFDELSELFIEHQNLADFLKKDRARVRLEVENELKEKINKAMQDTG